MARLVFRHTVEGLFLKANHAALTPGLRGELQRLGLDLDRVPQTLDAAVYQQAYERLRATVHPGLEATAADRKLGEAFIDAYFDTVLGGLMRSMVRILPIEKHLERATSNFESGVNFVTATTERIGPRAYRMKLNDYAAAPNFTAGVLSRMFVHAGVKEHSVTLELLDGRAFQLLLAWSPR